MVDIVLEGDIKVPYRTSAVSWKVVYVDDSGNEQDISDYVIEWFCKRVSLLYGIGNFEVMLDNHEKRFNDILTLGRVIKIYCEHVTSNPTIQIFRGKVDVPLFGLTADNAWTITIAGRDFPEVADDYIHLDYSNTAANSAISTLISEHLSGIITATSLPISLGSTNINETYQASKPITVISDILKKSAHDGYIDFNGDLIIFPDGSLRNETESIVYGHNLMPFDGFGIDYINARNKIIGIGSQQEGMFLISTKEDQELQTASWKKAEVINISSALNTTQLQEKTDSELNFRKVLRSTGTLSAKNGLPTLQPGQSLFCIAQYAGVDGYYVASSVTHQFKLGDGYSTFVEVSESRTGYEDLNRIENELSGINSDNPNGMTDTVFLFLFNDTNDLNLQNAEISKSKLIISTGSQGMASSSAETLESEPEEFEFRINGSDLDISTVKVSFDGGINFNNAGTLYNLETDKETAFEVTNAGTSCIVIITLNSDATYPDPQLDSFAILIKRG